MTNSASVDRPTSVRSVGLALAALLPLVVLAWPGSGSFVRARLEPEIGEAGVVALAALIPIAWLAATRMQRRAPALAAFAFVVALALALRWFGHPTDTLQADRSTVLMLALFSLALVGASLVGSARELWLAGATLVSLTLSIGALFDREHRFAGLFGNTGATSEAALGGAIVGAWWFANANGLRRGLGLAALVAYAIFVGLAPVFAGALSLGVATIALLANSREVRMRTFAVLLIAAASWGGGRTLALVERAGGPEAQASNLGGVAVRESIWKHVPAFVADHGPLGAGPGQFRAQFPPYRDSAELALERRAVGSDVETEIEHAHNDWLQGLCDLGWFGGSLWILFLAWTSWNAWCALASSDRIRAAFGAAALALAANAAVRAPVTWNGASAVVFAVAAGAVAASESSNARTSRVLRLAPWIVFVALGLCAPIAVALVAESNALTIGALDLGAAIDARSDSPLAWASVARASEAKNDAIRARAAWSRVLELCPFNLEAWMQLGWNAALRGDVAEARKRWTRARELDPEHPKLARNLLQLALRSNDRAELDRELALDASKNLIDKETRVGLAINAIFEGRELGLALLANDDATLANSSSDELVARADSLRKSGDPVLADALECQGQKGFARDLAVGGPYHDAVRVYRQALRLAKAHGSIAGDPLHFEFAAALALDGHADEARAELGDAKLSAAELAALPSWAGEALFKSGLLAR